LACAKPSILGIKRLQNSWNLECIKGRCSSMRNDKATSIQKLMTSQANNSVHWAAFLGDCEHKSFPSLDIESLSRIFCDTQVNVADLSQHNSSEVHSDEHAALKGSTLLRGLTDALNDPEFMVDGGLLGVPCMHLYEHESELPPSDLREEKIAVASSLRLKGVHALVYVATSKLWHPKLPEMINYFGNEACRATICPCCSYSSSSNCC
jgi:hypothetical protein